MKNILIIILITSFTILSYSSFSQKNYKESREIQEIKQIIKDNNNNKDNKLLFEGNDNEVIYLPFYFNSNKSRLFLFFMNSWDWIKVLEFWHFLFYFDTISIFILLPISSL